MRLDQLKWVPVTVMAAALSLAGCQKKDQASNPDQIAKSDKTDNTDMMAKNDAPESGSAGEGLNTQGTPGSPEIAHPGPQGSALAPQTDVRPPEKTAAEQGTGLTIANGKETVTTLPPATAPDTTAGFDPQAGRDSAATAAAERLAKLDARVSDIRAHIDQLSNKTVYTDTLTDLRGLHETAQGAIDAIRDPDVKLDDAREAADRRMTQFEQAINSLQKRVERSASQT